MKERSTLGLQRTIRSAGTATLLNKNIRQLLPPDSVRADSAARTVVRQDTVTVPRRKRGFSAVWATYSVRRQMQQVVNSLWETINRSVSESRGIAVGELNRIADALEVTLPEEALHRGFVDSLVYEDYMQEVFASYGVEPGSRGEYEFVTLGDYATQLRADLKNVSSSQVAIVYADGAIVDGDGTGKDVYGNTLAEKLARVRRNDKVRAVVLRVNSPGGSALACLLYTSPSPRDA